MSRCWTVRVCVIWQNTWKRPESENAEGLLQKIADSPGNRRESLLFKMQMVIAVKGYLKTMRNSISPLLQDL